MSKHTPEPWAHRNGRIFQADHDVLTIANIARAFDGDYSPENARRIVACVNACRGLPTDELEQNDFFAAVGTQLLDADARSAEKDREILRLTHMVDKSVDSRLAKALKQRDELLEALEYVVSTERGVSGRIIIDSHDEDVLKKVISKVKGGAA